ncbi:MAG: hypothetical protein KGO93_00745 [Cyanobacteria bacterium REEB446]|jgi:hypothetical protein|nr:hypothetical protein [Cyanobacteria bacterium REEB446]
MLIIFLLLFSLISPPSHAFKIGDIIRIADGQVNKYPEIDNRRIYFHTGSSPLAPLETPDDFILRSTELSKQTIERTFTLGAANKIIGLADGIINVKYQVQDGVNNALRDTFTGFFEYQRRKTSEEILNSNLQAHIDCINFLNEDLTNSSTDTNLMIILEKIMRTPLAESTFSFLQKIILVLLILSSMFKILDIAFFKSNSKSTQKDNHEFKSLFSSLFLSIALLLMLESIWEFIFSGFSLINNGFNSLLNNESLGFSIFHNHETLLIESWTAILNNYGYFPGLILAFIDSVSQFIFIISLLGSIILVIFAKVFSPIFLLNNKNPFSVFTYSLKILLGVSILPFGFNFLYKILSEFSFNNLSYFIYICFSILSLLLLSVIQIFFIFKLKKQ